MVRHMRNMMIFLSFFVFYSGLPAGAKSGQDKKFFKPVTAQQVQLLKAIEKKYQRQHGIHVKLKKKLTMATLASETESSGAAWFYEGKMKLEIKEPIASLVVADGEYLWLVSPAPKEFKGAKTQVTQIPMNSKGAKYQGLIQLLTRGGLLKHFSVNGVKINPKTVVFSLHPKKMSSDFERVLLTVDPTTKVISALQYWDRDESETFFEFTETKFNQNFDKDFFVYVVPKGASLTTK